MIDTSTRLLRPADLTRQVLGQLDQKAAHLVSEAMSATTAREVPDRLYEGRHRTTQDVTTYRIRPEQVAAARLPMRAPGAALHAPSPVSPRLGVLARALHALRGGR